MTAAAGYVTAVAGAALVVGAIAWMAGNSPAGMVCKIAGSLVLILVVLSPLHRLKAGAFRWISAGSGTIKQTVEEAGEASRKLQNSAVAEQVAAYAEKQAAALGIQADVTLETYADEENRFYIGTAAVAYKDRPSFEKRAQMEKILKDECGVAAENQEHVYDG